jgi:hypothetical protein
MSLVPVSTSNTALAGTPSFVFSIKLNSKNYLSWKTHFGLLLNLHNLHGFIDSSSATLAKLIPTSTIDPTPVSNPAYDDWFKKD